MSQGEGIERKRMSVQMVRTGKHGSPIKLHRGQRLLVPVSARRDKPGMTCSHTPQRVVRDLLSQLSKAVGVPAQGAASFPHLDHHDAIHTYVFPVGKEPSNCTCMWSNA